MIIYPAIDLMGARCVGLPQGRFDDVESYVADPVDAVLGFEKAGAEWAHIVDLDGAREGRPRQHGLIVDIALSVTVKLQVAGGFREPAHLERMFAAGVDRVVINSMEAEQPGLAWGLLDRFGADHIVLGFDVDRADGEPVVASGTTLWEAIASFPDARHILIAAGGSATGIHLSLAADAAMRFPDRAIQLSGSITSLSDLCALKGVGAAGAIVGKALWENQIGVEEALGVARA